MVLTSGMFSIAAVQGGHIMMMFSDAQPVMANYVPVLDGPVFVAGLVLCEALWLALLATLLGMAAGHGLVALIGQWLQNERSISLTGWVWEGAEGLVPALAAGVAVLAAALPAWGAYRLDVTTLLNSR